MCARKSGWQWILKIKSVPSCGSALNSPRSMFSQGAKTTIPLKPGSTKRNGGSTANRLPLRRINLCPSHSSCTPWISFLSVIDSFMSSIAKIIGVKHGGSPCSLISHVNACSDVVDRCNILYPVLGDEIEHAYSALFDSRSFCIRPAFSRQCFKMRLVFSFPSWCSIQYFASGNAKFPSSRVG